MEEWINGLGLDFKAIGTSAKPEPSEKGGEENDMINISLTFGASVFSAKPYDNETTRALIAQFPMTLNMTEINGLNMDIAWNN